MWRFAARRESGRRDQAAAEARLGVCFQGVEQLSV
jgi:hypothetical protein